MCIRDRVAHLADGHQLGHRAHGLLDRYVGVHPVLVVEVDDVHAEPLQRGVTGLPHVLGPPTDTANRRVVRLPNDAELGGEHHLVAPAGDGRADQPLIGERAVHVRGVQQGDAEIQRAGDSGSGLGLVRVAVELTHPHAAQPLGGDDEALAQRSSAHGVSRGMSGQAAGGSGGRSFAARTISTICRMISVSSKSLGVNTAATPAALSCRASPSGMIPPTIIGTSPSPAARRPSSTSGTAPMWLPDRIDNPTTCTYSSTCLLYTSDAADEANNVELHGR